MAKKNSSPRISRSKALAALRKRRPGDKLISELTEEERREFDAELARGWANFFRHHNVEVPNWLESLGLPRDRTLAAQIALAELGEFALAEDLGNIPMPNLIELIELADGKKRWGVRVAAQENPKPTSAEEVKQPPKKVRRLNVQKVQGSERRFRVCREPVTVSAKGARILDAVVSLQEAGETINPRNVMLRASYKLTKGERKTFETDKGRLNKVLIAAVEKGLYVKDDGEFRLQKPPAIRNKKTARRR